MMKRKPGDIGRELRKRHPLDNMSKKAKFVRAVRDVARTQSFYHWCNAREQGLDLILAGGFDLPIDQRVRRLFAQVEREIFNQTYEEER